MNIENFVEQNFFDKDLIEIWNISWFIIRIFLIILLIFFISVIIYALRKSSLISILWAKDLKRARKNFIIFQDQKNNEWAQITKRLSLKEEHSYKLAIIEAENFLSSVLQKMANPLTKDLEKEKKKIIKQYSIDDSFIKELSELKENISNDMNYFLDRKKTKKILNKCETALKILGVLPQESQK